ncbi:MAG: hypothetical protein INQ03_23780 [Candidatus Heimdallarchaeota archaeon]|nr:hypothetical protein [Candidatus Heimdallarchaeota archaeon]
MSQRTSFEISQNVISQDNFEIEILGTFVKELKLDHFSNSMNKYCMTKKFLEIMKLLELEDLALIDEFAEFKENHVKLTTIRAIQQENPDEIYEINPDLENKGKKKGFLSRFRK